MKNLIFGICFIGIFFIANAEAHAIKSYKKITADNEAIRKGVVQVEESEPITKTIILTLDLVNTKIDQLTNKIFNLQSELADWQSIKVKVDAEASKVILKTKGEK
jgi:hypothetical protein